MSSTLTSLGVAAGFVLCWSSGFIGGRLATESTMPVLALFTLRFLIASLVAGLVWLAWQRRPLCRLSLIREAVIGSLTMGGYLLGVILAIRFGVSAGLTALIAALQPLLAASLAGPWLGERMAPIGWAGMVLASLGVALCVMGEMNSGQDVPLWAYGFPLLSVIAVTLGSLLSAHWSTALPLAPTLTVQLLATTGVFALATLVAGQELNATAILDTPTLAALGWLILLSSFGGYGFFVASLRRLGVSRTSTLVYLTPPVTLIWAAAMFAEVPGLAGLMGVGIALVGVVLALRGVKALSTQVQGSVVC